VRVSGGDQRVDSAPTVSSAASWLAGRIGVSRGVVSSDTVGTGIRSDKRGGLWMRWHRHCGSVAQRFVAASGIGILVSGGQRCRWHLHRHERRTVSAMLLVISRRKKVVLLCLEANSSDTFWAVREDFCDDLVLAFLYLWLSDTDDWLFVLARCYYDQYFK
jgi:hypothetical protein